MSNSYLAVIVLFGAASIASGAAQPHTSQSPATAGQRTTLQAAKAIPISGSASRQSPLLIGPCDVIDDGSSENGLGLSAPTGTDVLWMQRQGDIGQSTVVLSISTVWGTPAFAGSGPADGSTARYGIWTDSDNDGDPTTGVLTLVAGPFSAIVSGSESDNFQVLPLSTPVVVSDTYFIGVSSEGAFPAPLDQSVVSGGRSWIAANGSGAGTIDYSNPSGEPIPLSPAFSPGVFLLRADCLAKGTVVEICAGDGSLVPCPCNNDAPAFPVQGCLWMTNNPPVLSTTGGHLEQVSGTIASIGAPIGTQLKLNCSGHRASAAAVSVLMQGQDPTAAQFAYGNGLRCIQGPLKRLYIVTPTPASVTTPDDSTTPTTKMSDRAAALGDVYFPGVIRGYQFLYRDPLGACGTYNASNGVLVVWAP
jgi:hypothetical protein